MPKGYERGIKTKRRNSLPASQRVESVDVTPVSGHCSLTHTQRDKVNYPNSPSHAHTWLENCQRVLYFPNLLPLATFCCRPDHRLSRRLESLICTAGSRPPQQYDLSPTYRYMIAVCMFAHGCGNFIDNVVLFVSLPPRFLSRAHF